jgi:hypothetical protein
MVQAYGPSVDYFSVTRSDAFPVQRLDPYLSTGDGRAGQVLTIACQLGGESVTGSSRTSARWDRPASGALVSDAYLVHPRSARG